MLRQSKPIAILLVETPAQKTRAEQLASEAKGVKKVVNNLQVEKK